MAINFPNNPSANDTFTVGNIEYVYLNGKWQVNAGTFNPTITNAATGQTLVWNGTAWVNGASFNPTITNPSIGQTLVWNGSQWQNDDAATGVTSVATTTDLPATGNPGDFVYVTATGDIYFWNGFQSEWWKISATYVYTSVAELISAGVETGVYTINVNSTEYTGFFDASIGYMLYSSFASDNSLSESSALAVNGNNILYSQLATYGYSTSANTDSWADGVTTGGGFSTYSRKPGFLSIYAGGAPTGTFQMDSWNGPSNATALRAIWGDGASNYTSTNGLNAYFNEVVVRSSFDGTVTDTGSFDPAGTTPLAKITEGGILGVSEIWFK